MITANIPLTTETIEKNTTTLNPHNEHYTPTTIHKHLTIHDFINTLHTNKIQTNKPNNLSQHNHQTFTAKLKK